MSERLSTPIRPHLLKNALHLHMNSSFQKGSTLTSNLILLERIYTYIRPHLVRMALHLYLIMWEHIPQSHQNDSALIYDHVGTHPAITLEWIYIDHVGTHPCWQPTTTPSYSIMMKGDQLYFIFYSKIIIECLQNL